MEEKNKYVLVNIKEKYFRKLLLLSSRLCFIRMKVLAPQFSEKNQVFGPTLQLLVFLDAPKEITAVYVDSKLVIVFMVSEKVYHMYIYLSTGTELDGRCPANRITANEISGSCKIQM